MEFKMAPNPLDVLPVIRTNRKQGKSDTSNRTHFTFPVKILRERCYRPILKDGSLGKPHIVGIASSDSLDSYNEYFALTALTEMTEYAKERKSRKDEGLVELRETHWDTFAIGTLSDGWVDKNATTNKIEFFIDVELKEEYPAAMELFNDIIEGVVDKQMSVGGWIDWAKGDNAFEWEEREFTDEDGNVITFWVGRINHFILEHVAVTLPGWAANNDTEFIDAMLRTGGNPQFQKYMAKSKEQVMLELKSNSPSPDGVMSTKSADPGLSPERKESHMPESDNSKKTLKLGELLKTQIDSVPQEEREEVMKGLGEILGIVTEPTIKSDPTSEPAPEVNKTDDTPKEEEVVKTESSEEDKVEKTGDIGDKVEKDVQTEITSLEDTTKSVEDKTPDTEISVLRTEVDAVLVRLDEIAKEHNHPEFDELKAHLDSIKGFSDAVVKMGEAFDARLKNLENLNGVSKAASPELGEDVTASAPVEKVKTVHKTVWAPY